MSSEAAGHGRRNLIILGFGALAIAMISTAISLQIYRATGDIYLDRSRPGYIAEGEKHDEKDDYKNIFSNEGAVTADMVDEYLEKLDGIIEQINNASGDFSLDVISDDALSIATEGEKVEEVEETAE